MRAIRLTWLLAGLSMALFVGGLAFRAFLYGRMYLGPDAPHGIADVIEFLLGWALLASLALSAAWATALAMRGPRHNRIAAAWLAGLVIAVLAVLGPLHTLAARLGSA